MSVAIELNLDQDARKALLELERAGKKIDKALATGVTRGLVMIERDLKMNELRGGDRNAKRDGQGPLAVRSGTLQSSIVIVKDNDLEGKVGVQDGPASRYAYLLGEGEVTITPNKANHLWIAAGKNRMASGAARMTPREAVAEMVKESEDYPKVWIHNYQYVLYQKSKRSKPRLLFVLKKKVIVKGTAAMKHVSERMSEPVAELLLKQVQGVFN